MGKPKEKATFADLEAMAEDMRLRSMLLQTAVRQVKARQVEETAEGDEDDIGAIQAVIDGVRAGTIETFPGELVSKLVEGSNPVRIFREFRQITGKDLAKKAGISRPYLTQIETGKREPMFPVMVKIAHALDVSLDLLAPSPEELASA